MSVRKEEPDKPQGCFQLYKSWTKKEVLVILAMSMLDFCGYACVAVMGPFFPTEVNRIGKTLQVLRHRRMWRLTFHFVMTLSVWYRLKPKECPKRWQVSYSAATRSWHSCSPRCGPKWYVSDFVVVLLTYEVWHEFFLRGSSIIPAEVTQGSTVVLEFLTACSFVDYSTKKKSWGYPSIWERILFGVQSRVRRILDMAPRWLL